MNTYLFSSVMRPVGSTLSLPGTKFEVDDLEMLLQNSPVGENESCIFFISSKINTGKFIMYCDVKIHYLKAHYWSLMGSCSGIMLCFVIVIIWGFDIFIGGYLMQ